VPSAKAAPPRHVSSPPEREGQCRTTVPRVLLPRQTDSMCSLIRDEEKVLSKCNDQSSSLVAGALYSNQSATQSCLEKWEHANLHGLFEPVSPIRSRRGPPTNCKQISQAKDAEVAKETYVRNRSRYIAWYAGIAPALSSREIVPVLAYSLFASLIHPFCTVNTVRHLKHECIQ
jgi:hypothetical protein